MTRHRRRKATLHWHMGKYIIKCPQRSCWSMEKAVMCMREGEKTSLWTPAKKTGSFQSHQARKTRYVSRHFRRIAAKQKQIKANKVSNSEEARKVEYAYDFWKCAYLKLPKIIKVSPCLTKLQQPKLARFLRQCSCECIENTEKYSVSESSNFRQWLFLSQRYFGKLKSNSY